MGWKADTWTSQAPSRRRLVLTVQLAVVAVVLLFVGSTVPPRNAYSHGWDGWVQPVGYALIAFLAVLRPVLSSRGRLIWSLIAAGLVARAAAFAGYVGVVRQQVPVPYPSVADLGWLLSIAFLMAGLLVLARARFRRLPSTLVFDGIVGASAVGAVSLLVLPQTVDRLGVPGSSRSALLVNALYPAADVALILAVLGLLIAYHWQATPALWTFGAGAVGFAVVDCAYLYELSQGSFRPGTPLSALSMLATAAMGFSCWAPRGQPAQRRRGYVPGLVIPATLATACLAVLVHAAFVDDPAWVVVLAAVGVGATVVRTLLAFRDLRQLSAVRREARTDDLTGLPNRRAFNEAVERALRHRSPNEPLALLLLDLDSFKEVNDSLGHHRGDELLGLVAPRLNLVCRPQDLAARIGGDEFAVLVNGADGRAAAAVAERVRAACRGPFTIASRTLTVGASVGIAVFPQDGLDAASLLQHADNAMYAAKEDRTGHSFYRADYHQASRTRLDAVAEIRAAIEQDQFVLHYQPKIALGSGQVVGVEALVRWQHPEQGLLAPYTFLAQAERGGLMRELTVALVDQALKQWRCWREQGIDTSIAVNLSVSDLLDSTLPDRVATALAHHDVPGSALLLELTEDLLLADPTRGHSVVEGLSTLGIRMQVDDYGTGYSTLGYLRDLPSLHGLKLDRSFVTNLLEDRRSQAIVQSTVLLAADLGLELVAEGVETEAVRDRLAAMGCPQAQGYLFGRPKPADEVSFGVFDVEQASFR